MALLFQRTLLCLAICQLLLTANAGAQGWDPSGYGDRTLDTPVELPEWFTVSFLEIYDDVQQTKANGKKGLILYFGQDDCPYCRAHLENNWGKKDIVSYTRRYFDVIHVDVKGARNVTDYDGRVFTEKGFAEKYGVQFTPTLLFMDLEGQVIQKLVGYRTPYQFRAVLEYVADEHYRKENLRTYLARAEGASSYGNRELNDSEFFIRPPYRLKREAGKRRRPLVVFFEEPRCHACDVLHAGPMSDSAIVGRLKIFESVQLDTNSETPVQTPAGETMSARQWADGLNINYTPTLVFFGDAGEEIIRVDSVVGFYRLRSVLDFILARVYETQPSYLKWREQKRLEQ